jgi:hypothetical protein
MAVVATSTFPVSGTSSRTAAAVASRIARVRSAGNKLRARRGFQDAQRVVGRQGGFAHRRYERVPGQWKGIIRYRIKSQLDNNKKAS